MTNLNSTQRFSPRVAYYVRSRPNYPKAVLTFFQSELKFTPTQTVADIGSGTGILTELFLQNGNDTYAVEPNADMRGAAEAALSVYHYFHNVNGTAEATTLADQSVDLITAAQAFHWFDIEKTAKEFSRILRPSGFVALIWNDRKSSPFTDDYDALIERHQTNSATTKARTVNNETNMRAFFGPGGYEVRVFDNPQNLDRRGLVDRLTSASYMPLPEDPRYAGMLDAADELFDKHQHNGIVTQPHNTKVYVGKPKS